MIEITTLAKTGCPLINLINTMSNGTLHSDGAACSARPTLPTSRLMKQSRLVHCAPIFSTACRSPPSVRRTERTTAPDLITAAHIVYRPHEAAITRYPILVSNWEAEFLAGLPRLPRRSSKQRSILLRIAVRLCDCGCEL
jgi:hypothetical protein